MELPALCLTVEKGRKKGETIECKPGAAAHIGRVIRGNNLAVRDPGVSQKHLFFQFLPDASRWAVSDLDTSNGTIVNDYLIPASVPFPISDGDTIKIGESTVISVKFIAAQRQDTVEINGDNEEEKEKERTGVCTRRGRQPRKAPPPIPPVVESAVDVSVGRNGRKAKGRSRKGAAAAFAIADATASVPKKDESLKLPNAVQIIEVEAKNHGLAKGRPKKGAAASSAIADATASVQQKDESLGLPAAEEIIVVEARNPGLAKGRPKKGAAASSAIADATASVQQKDESLGLPAAEEIIVVEARNLGLAKGRSRRPTRRSSAAKVSNDQDEMKNPHGSVEVPDSGADEAVEIGNALAGSCAAEEVAGCGGRENPGTGEVESPVESVEQMTLGEWFDRMEKILPLMVNDAANDTIASLRSIAQCFGQFIAMSSTSH